MHSQRSVAAASISRTPYAIFAQRPGPAPTYRYRGVAGTPAPFLMDACAAAAPLPAGGSSARRRSAQLCQGTELLRGGGDGGAPSWCCWKAVSSIDVEVERPNQRAARPGPYKAPYKRVSRLDGDGQVYAAAYCTRPQGESIGPASRWCSPPAALVEEKHRVRIQQAVRVGQTSSRQKRGFPASVDSWPDASRQLQHANGKLQCSVQTARSERFIPRLPLP